MSEFHVTLNDATVGKEVHLGLVSIEAWQRGRIATYSLRHEGGLDLVYLGVSAKVLFTGIRDRRMNGIL